MMVSDASRPMTAERIARCVRQGDLSAVEVTQATLEQLAVIDPQINAFCTPTADAALASAARLDRRRAAGDIIGPFAGVPFAVKDLILTRGVRTTFGSPLYAHYVPEEDDIVVARMLAADAILVGKTNTSELGYAGHGRNTLFPPTRNPWNTGLTPGGSSAGSAAAVAAGIVPWALGSDGGGSIRIPAGFCGIVGMKPSMGRVPLWPGCRDDRFPGISSWESLEHIGPLTRTVADAALMLSVLAGPHPRDRHSIPNDIDWLSCTRRDLRGLRIAYSADLGRYAVDPAIRAALDNAAAVFETDLGCIVKAAEPALPPDVGKTFAAFEAMDTDLVAMRHLYEPHRDTTSPELLRVLDRRWTAEDFTNAVIGRKRLCRLFANFMQDYDLLLTPTLACLPFPLLQDGPDRIDGRPIDPDDWACFSVIPNMTGQPAISVNMGWSSTNLPIGLQIVGRHLDDACVLAAAAGYEAACGQNTTWLGEDGRRPSDVTP